MSQSPTRPSRRPSAHDWRLERRVGVEKQPADRAEAVDRGRHVERQRPVLRGPREQVADHQRDNAPAMLPNMFIAPDTVPAYRPPMSMHPAHAAGITKSLNKPAIPRT